MLTAGEKSSGMITMSGSVVFLLLVGFAITSFVKERANLSAFPTFVRFVVVWFCLFPLPLGVWEGLRLVIVALLDFSLTFFALFEDLGFDPVSLGMFVYCNLLVKIHGA